MPIISINDKSVLSIHDLVLCDHALSVTITHKCVQISQKLYTN